MFNVSIIINISRNEMGNMFSFKGKREWNTENIIKYGNLVFLSIFFQKYKYIIRCQKSM